MLKFIKSFFGGKKVEETAPYKVEAPANNYEDLKSVKSAEVSEQATEAVVASIQPAKKAPAKKAPAKKAGAPKKQGTAKPRKPKAPKQPKA